MIKKIINMFILGSLLLAFGATSGCIENPNSASYRSDSLNMGKIDLNDITKKANNAGYSVKHEVAYSGGLQPVTYINGLNEKMGNDYKITTVHYNYNDMGLALSLNEMPQKENSATLTFQGSSDFPLNKEVPEDWVIEMLLISFDMNRQDAENYVALLKNDLIIEDTDTEEPVMGWMENGNMMESKTGNAKVRISEKPNINSIYYYLDDESTNSSLYFDYPGSCGEDFFNGDNKICSVDYTLPLITVTRTIGGHTYRVYVDGHGTAKITVKVKEINEEIPENEYKAVLKEMFVDLGLNPNQVDEFEFDYDPYH